MQPGRRFDRYELLEILGAGSFATVWRAHDPVVGLDVALKILAENWSRVPEIADKFRTEARVMMSAQSSRIVRVFHVSEWEGQPYIVMAIADGGTLDDRIKSRADVGPFPLDEALALGVEMARAVDDVHMQGLLHRDVKPANVLFSSTPASTMAGSGEQLMLGDFTFARAVDNDAFTMVSGSPAYTAPEQAAGGDLSAAADVFPLGVIVLELLTGARPHGATSMGGAASHEQIAAAPHLHAAGIPAPPELVALLDRTVSRDPSLRPSAAEFAAGLEAIRSHLANAPGPGAAPIAAEATVVPDHLVAPPPAVAAPPSAVAPHAPPAAIPPAPAQTPAPAPVAATPHAHAPPPSVNPLPVAAPPSPAPSPPAPSARSGSGGVALLIGLVMLGLLALGVLGFLFTRDGDTSPTAEGDDRPVSTPEETPPTAVAEPVESPADAPPGAAGTGSLLLVPGLDREGLVEIFGDVHGPTEDLTATMREIGGFPIGLDRFDDPVVVEVRTLWEDSFASDEAVSGVFAVELTTSLDFDQAVAALDGLEQDGWLPGDSERGLSFDDRPQFTASFAPPGVAEVRFSDAVEVEITGGDTDTPTVVRITSRQSELPDGGHRDVLDGWHRDQLFAGGTLVESEVRSTNFDSLSNPRVDLGFQSIITYAEPVGEIEAQLVRQAQDDGWDVVADDSGSGRLLELTDPATGEEIRATLFERSFAEGTRLIASSSTQMDAAILDS